MNILYHKISNYSSPNQSNIFRHLVTLLRFNSSLFFDYSISNFYLRNLLTNALKKSYNTPTQAGGFTRNRPHALTTMPYKKLSAPTMPDHIKSGADFMTTCLTTFRTGLPGDSSTRRTLYQFFRTKKHVLDAISRKKLYPFAWGGRGRKFKSCHSDQKGDSSESPFFFVFLRLSLVFSLFVFSFLFRETFENRGFLADFSDCYLKLLPKFFAFPFRTPNCYSKSFTTIE